MHRASAVCNDGCRFFLYLIWPIILHVRSVSVCVHLVHQKGIVIVLCDFRPECFNFAKSNSNDRKNPLCLSVCALNILHVHILENRVPQHSKKELRFGGKQLFGKLFDVSFELNDGKMHLGFGVCACFCLSVSICLYRSALHSVRCMIYTHSATTKTNENK